MYMYTIHLLCFVFPVTLLVNFYCGHVQDHYTIQPHAINGLLALVSIIISKLKQRAQE